MLPHFDYSISLGTIATVIGFVYAIAFFKAKIDLMLSIHTQDIAALHDRMDKHDTNDDRRFQELSNRMFDLVSSVQRLVGQAETKSRGDRRNG